MSSHTPKRSSRQQRAQALPLPSFSFPAAPRRDSIDPAMQPSRQTPASPSPAAPRRRHRRSDAVSTSLSRRAAAPAPLSVAIPPVPAIPAIYRSGRPLASEPMSRQQLSGRSISDVSTCPTLEPDSGVDSPEPFVLDSRPLIDYFSLHSRKSQDARNVELASSPPPTSDGTPAEGCSDQEDDDDDDDDDEEFWHCRGVPDCLLTSRKSSLATDLDGMEHSAIDVGAWAKSIDSFLFPDVPSTRGADLDDESYMDLMRHPLLTTTSWLDI